MFSSLTLTACAHAPRSLRLPSSACDVRAFGAKGDGKTKDTAALQRAIDQCTTGTVVLHGGTFLSGTIKLKNDIELRIDPGAVLKGSTDDRDYPDLHPNTTNSQLNNCRKALIYSEHANNLVIDGGGTIDGSGQNPRWNGKEFTRPMAIFLALSDQIAIHDVHVKNAGMWSVVMFESDNVTIHHLDVNSPFGPTRDGIDIVDGHHVLIEDSTFLSEDDAICLKSGSSRGVEDVTVRNCHVLRSGVANGLKLGTASTGSFKKILFENIDLKDMDKAAMAVESVDGSEIDGVEFRDIRFANAGSAVFVLLGKRGNAPAVGSIKNVAFTNVSGTVKHPWGSAISGTLVDGVRYAPQALRFIDVKVQALAGAHAMPADPAEYAGQYPDPNLWGDLPSYGFYFRHVDGVSWKGSAAQTRVPDPRPGLVTRDVTGFTTN